jgi:GTP-binding protein
MPSMKYIKSAVFPKDYPPATTAEIAVAGRSNAGKSTFLNGIAGGKVAKVSQVPGKTRLLNFFDFNSYRFVDMPGYGFASRSGDEMEDWTQMIETYLSTRGSLRGLVLVMDIRREWTGDEQLLKKFCNRVNVPICVVATKIDKCRQNEIQKYLTELKKKSQMLDVFPVSGETKKGIKEVEEFIFENWVKT